jgi:hypothetical protein
MLLGINDGLRCLARASQFDVFLETKIELKSDLFTLTGKTYPSSFYVNAYLGLAKSSLVLAAPGQSF